MTHSASTAAGRSRRTAMAAVRLYVVFTPAAVPDDPYARLADALASGVIDAVQLRLKASTDAPLDQGAVDAAAQVVLTLCDTHGALFLLNDDPGAAVRVGAHGVHIGQDDDAPGAARAVIGNDRLVGLSTHDPDEVRAARDMPVDYLGLGPCFSTASKTLDRAPGGAALVSACRPLAGDLPIFPIGGIGPGNAALLTNAGADRLAVGAGILGAADPAAAAMALRSHLPD